MWHNVESSLNTSFSVKFLTAGYIYIIRAAPSHLESSLCSASRLLRRTQKLMIGNEMTSLATSCMICIYQTIVLYIDGHK